MSAQTEPPEDFALEAGDASTSRDSALQYVAADILESGGGQDAQTELVEPVEEEIREHWEIVARNALSRAFIAGPQDGAKSAIHELTNRLEYEDVPEEHRDDVQAAVEARLEQKASQLELLLDEILSDAKRRAVNESEDAVLDWVTIV